MLQQQKAAWAECTCAGAAHKNFSLILCCVFFSSLVPVSPAQRDEARHVEVQYRVSVRGGALSLVLIVQATAEEVHRVIAYRDLNPGYVGAMH